MFSDIFSGEIVYPFWLLFMIIAYLHFAIHPDQVLG